MGKDNLEDSEEEYSANSAYTNASEGPTCTEVCVISRVDSRNDLRNYPREDVNIPASDCGSIFRQFTSSLSMDNRAAMKVKMQRLAKKQSYVRPSSVVLETSPFPSASDLPNYPRKDATMWDTKSDLVSGDEDRSGCFLTVVDLLNYYLIRSEGHIGRFLRVFFRLIDIWACLQYVIDFEWSENYGNEQQMAVWGWTGILFLMVFSVEYVGKIIGHYGYPSIQSYAFSWLGLLDLFVVLACLGEVTMQGIEVTTETLVMVRMSQITWTRLFGLLRTTKVINLQWSLKFIRCTEMTRVILSMFTLIFLSAGIFACFDDLRDEFVNPYKNIFGNTDTVSWFNSFYFSFTTVLAVGYGDIVPKTIAARMVCSAVMLVAYALMAYNITRLLDAFTEAHRLQRENELAKASKPQENSDAPETAEQIKIITGIV